MDHSISWLNRLEVYALISQGNAGAFLNSFFFLGKSTLVKGKHIWR